MFLSVYLVPLQVYKGRLPENNSTGIKTDRGNPKDLQDVGVYRQQILTIN